jgi:hypothetical protein
MNKQTILETNTRVDTNVNQTTVNQTTALNVKKLTLKRETVRNLNDDLLTSQGHSLWTCDVTGGPAAKK